MDVYLCGRAFDFVETYDFSSHGNLGGLLSFLESCRGTQVITYRCDRCPAFAEELAAEGFDASVPELDETVVGRTPPCDYNQ